MIRDPKFFGKNRFAHIETVLQAYERELADHGLLTLPATEPLVVGNTAVFRTLARLRAVDLRTGERLWDFLECDRLYGILAAAEHQTHGGNRLPVNLEVNEPGADLHLFLNSRSFPGQELRHAQQRRAACLRPARHGLSRAGRIPIEPAD